MPEERESGRKAVLREKEVLKGLSHPALPGIIDFFEEEQESFLVMEYVEGITLEQYLRKFIRVEAETAVRWAVALTEVLGYLHEQNPPILYRDLKPANIMIQPDGSIRLVDFGAAGSSCYGRRREAFLCITPGYAPPELWKGKDAGKTCDIYGIGVVLHEMLTGIRPGGFGRPLRPVREYDRSISGELQRIIAVCTAAREQDRYQSMGKLKEALLHYKEKDAAGSRRFRRKRAAGLLLWLLAAGRSLLPFLKGVEADSFPFPYCRIPLLLFGIAAGYFLLFLRKKPGEGRLQKQEKSLFLTEKKFNGLYAVLGLILFLVLLPFTGDAAAFRAQAAMEQEELWVEMKDEKGRKLLLKEDAVYKTGDRFRFEIPAGELPDKPLCLWLLAEGEQGELYQSRPFLIQAEKEKQDSFKQAPD